MARPLSLNKVYERRPVLDPDRRPTGETRDVTIGDRIIELTAQGAPAERAARAAGISTATYYGWTSQVGKARVRSENGGAPLTKNERDLCEFLDAVEQAEAEWEMKEHLLLARAEQGVVIETTVETFDADGRLTERRVTRRNNPGSVGAIIWRLRQAFPDRYKERVEGPERVGEQVVTDRAVDLLLDETEEFLRTQAP